MAVAKLTNAVLSKARADAVASGRRVEVWDEAMRSLFVRVGSSGDATYYAKYRAGGVQRKLKLGSAATLSIDQARAEARKALGAVAGGDDPVAKRQTAREVPRFDEAVRRYLESLTSAPRTITTYRQRLEKYAVPEFGRRRIVDVEFADVRRLHERLTKAGNPVAANRVVETMRAFYNWAAEEWPATVTANPARRVRRNAESVRERLVESTERRELMAAIDAAAARPPKTDGHISPTAANAFRLIFVQGLRPIDVVTLHHDNIQRGISNGKKIQVATWPGRGTKKRNQRRVLNSAAIQILEDQAAITGGKGLVFPNARGRALTSNALARTFRKLRDDAGLAKDLTLYSARHTYVSEGVMDGIPLAVMGADVDNANAVHRYAHLQRAVDEGVSERTLRALKRRG
jgi:integrase